MFYRILGIAVAGVIGTLARYFIGGWAQSHWGSTFPWATWLINGSGCFFFSFVWALSEERFLISPEWRLIVLTGFMGAYTTYSTYMFEVGQLVRGGQWWMAAADFCGQNVLGFILLLLGYALARAI